MDTDFTQYGTRWQFCKAKGIRPTYNDDGTPTGNTEYVYGCEGNDESPDEISTRQAAAAAFWAQQNPDPAVVAEQLRLYNEREAARVAAQTPQERADEEARKVAQAAQDAADALAAWQNENCWWQGEWIC
jgi:hypothetical protein